MTNLSTMKDLGIRVGSWKHGTPTQNTITKQYSPNSQPPNSIMCPNQFKYELQLPAGREFPFNI